MSVNSYRISSERSLRVQPCLAAGGDDEASADLRQQWVGFFFFGRGGWCAAAFPALLPNEPRSGAPEQKSDKSTVWINAATFQQASVMLLISLGDAKNKEMEKEKNTTINVFWVRMESASLATAAGHRFTWPELNEPPLCCRVRAAAFDANFVALPCEMQTFRSHNAIILSAQPTGRRLQTERL